MVRTSIEIRSKIIGLHVQKHNYPRIKKILEEQNNFKISKNRFRALEK